MKIKVPSKTVSACDLCGRETNILERCLICGKEYCIICEPYLPGCFVKPRVCKNCDGRDDVKRVVGSYSASFASLIRRREQGLKRLAKKAKAGL